MAQIGATPAGMVSDAAQLGAKMLSGGELMNRMRDADGAIATIPKDLVWSQDKVSLFHYRPLAEKRIGVPVLICHGLVGR